MTRVRGGEAGSALCPHMPLRTRAEGADMWPGFYPPGGKPAPRANSPGDDEPAGWSSRGRGIWDV